MQVKGQLHALWGKSCQHSLGWRASGGGGEPELATKTYLVSETLYLKKKWTEGDG